MLTIFSFKVVIQNCIVTFFNSIKDLNWQNTNAEQFLVYLERFHSRGQQLQKFIEQKKVCA